MVEQLDHFSVNIPGAVDEDVANCFVGRGGLKGIDRYHGEEWTTLDTGAPVPADALAVVPLQ